MMIIVVVIIIIFVLVVANVLWIFGKTHFLVLFLSTILVHCLMHFQWLLDIIIGLFRLVIAAGQAQAILKWKKMRFSRYFQVKV